MQKPKPKKSRNPYYVEPEPLDNKEVKPPRQPYQEKRIKRISERVPVSNERVYEGSEKNLPDNLQNIPINVTGQQTPTQTEGNPTLLENIGSYLLNTMSTDYSEQQSIEQNLGLPKGENVRLENLVPEDYGTARGVLSAIDVNKQINPETIKQKVSNLLSIISTDESEKKSIEQGLGLPEGTNPVEETLKSVSDSWEQASKIDKPDGTPKPLVARSIEYASAITNTAFALPMIVFSTLKNVPVVGEAMEQYVMKELVAVTGIAESVINNLSISDYNKEKAKELSNIVGVLILSFAHRVGKSPAEVVKENPPELKEIVNTEVQKYISREFQLPEGRPEIPKYGEGFLETPKGKTTESNKTFITDWKGETTIMKEPVGKTNLEEKPEGISIKVPREDILEVDRRNKISKRVEGALTEKLIEYENEILNPKKTADEIIELQNSIDKVKTKLEKVKEPTAKELSDNLKNELGELNKEIAERQKTETKPIDNGKEKVQEKTGEVENQAKLGLSDIEFKALKAGLLDNARDKQIAKISTQEAYDIIDGKIPFPTDKLDMRNLIDVNLYKDIKSLKESIIDTFNKLGGKEGRGIARGKIDKILEGKTNEEQYKLLDKVYWDLRKTGVVISAELGNKIPIEKLFGKDTPNTKSPFKLDLEKDGLTPETFWKDVQGKLEQNAGQTGIAKAYEQAKTRLSKLSDTALDASSLPFKVAEYLKDISIVGAYWINKGVRRIGDWTRKMTQELGDKAVPYLKDIWEGLNRPPQLREGAELHTMGFGRKQKSVETKTERIIPPMTLKEFGIKNEGKIPPSQMVNEYNRVMGMTPEVKFIPITKTERVVKGDTVETKAPRKISDAVTRETKKKETGFTMTQKADFNMTDMFEPIKRHIKDLSPTGAKAHSLNWYKLGTDIGNVVEGKGLRIVNRETGNIEIREGSIKDIAKVVKGKEKDWADYLVARKVVEDNNKINELKSKPETKENLAEIERLLNIQKKNNLDLADAQRIVKEKKGTFAKTVKGEFKDPEKMFDGMYSNLLDLMYESNLIDKVTRDKYKSEKGHASFKRDMSDTESPLFSSSLQSGVSSLKERVGSERKILDPMYNLVMDSAEIITKALENNLWNGVLNDAKKYPQLKEHFPEVKPFTRESLNALKVVVDGKAKFFNPSPEFRAMWESMRLPERDIFARILGLPKNFFTQMTTSMNPLFALGNIPVDQWSAWMNTKTGMNPLHTLETIGKIIADSETRNEFKRYKDIGGERLTFHASMDASPEAFMLKMLGQETSKTQRVLRKVEKGYREFTDVGSLPSTLTEQVTRATEFLRAKKQGRSDIEALWMASEVTFPFERRGAYQKFLIVRQIVDSIPYLNAGLEVLAKTGRAFKDNPKRFSAVVAGGIALGMSASTITLMFGSEQQKQEFGQKTIKELSRYLYLPNPSGVGFTRIRIPEIIGGFLAMGEITQFSGYRKNGWKDYADALTAIIPTQFNPLNPREAGMGWIPQILKPTVEVIANRKAYPEFSTIEPNWMEGSKKPSERTFDSTSEMGKWVGKMFDISPILADYWVRNQGGTVLSLLWGLPKSIDKLIDPLSTKPENFVMSGKSYNDFYDKRKELTQEYNYVRDTDDIDKASEIRRDKSLYDHVADVFSDARKIYDKTKDVSQETKTKMFNIVRGLEENTPKEAILSTLEELSKTVEELKKKTPIESNNKPFYTIKYEVNLLESEKKAIEEKFLRTQDMSLKPRYDKIREQIDALKATDKWYEIKETEDITTDEKNALLEPLKY